MLKRLEVNLTDLLLKGIHRSKTARLVSLGHTEAVDTHSETVLDSEHNRRIV